MKANVVELLAKAQKPGEDAMRLHPFYRGKLEVTPKCAIRSCEDFSIWYTPGVAAPCRDIAQHPEKVFAHTNKANFIAIVSDGTRVLGLGDIGPHAALPVKGLSEERILPTMDDWEVFPREAAAVGLKAMAQGVARKTLTKNELIDGASKIISRSRQQTKTLLEHGVISPME
jgi:malic enzyme